MRRARLIVTLGLPLLLLGAKSSKKGESAPPDASASSAQEMTRQLLDTMSMNIQVTLEDPGAEPRQALVFKPRAGAVTTTEMTQHIAMSMVVKGQSMAMPPQDMVTTQRCTVSAPDAAGNTRVHTEVVDVSSPAGAAAGNALTGMAFDLVVSPAGRVTGVEVTGGGDPMVSEMVGRMSKEAMQSVATFPADPVGVGARWTTEAEVGMAGIPFIAETTSTLRSLTDARADLDVTIQIRAGDSQLQFPGLPPDAKLDLTKLVGTGTGTQSVDLTTLTNTLQQKMTMDMEMTMSMGASPGGPGGMTMAMHMDQEIGSVVVPGE